MYAEITLNEARKHEKGTSRVQAGNLKNLAGQIASKHEQFDDKIRFMIDAGLDE